MMVRMLVVRATAKLRDRLAGTPATAGEESTTLLGDWYANLMPGRPQVAILVNARTLVPALVPLAPAKGLLSRVPDAVATVLEAHGVPAGLVAAERERMSEVRVAPTADRQVVGSTNEFVFLAGHYRGQTPDLHELSMRLAHVPCGPLFRRHTYPDRELASLVEELGYPATGPM